MSTTTLALSPVIKTTAITPPPKKSEIIHALAVRKHKQLIDAKTEAHEKLDAAEKELKRLVLEHVMSLPVAQIVREASVNPHRHSEYVRTHGDIRGRFIRNGAHTGINVNFRLLEIKPDDFTPAMLKQMKIIIAVQDGEALHVPDFKVIKQGIKDTMSGEMSSAELRMKALLEDEAVCKSLDRTLAKIEKQKINAGAIAA